MKVFEWICWIFALFATAVGIWYGIWTHWSEPVGPVGLFLGAGLGYMLGFYFLMTHRKLGAGPEDQADGMIDQVQGDYGFFSPYSWSPLFLAIPAAICVLGLAVGWWMFLIGVFLVPVALVIWTFEYWKGEHAQ